MPCLLISWPLYAVISRYCIAVVTRLMVINSRWCSPFYRGYIRRFCDCVFVTSNNVSALICYIILHTRCLPFAWQQTDWTDLLFSTKFYCCCLSMYFAVLQYHVFHLRLTSLSCTIYCTIFVYCETYIFNTFYTFLCVFICALCTISIIIN